MNVALLGASGNAGARILVELVSRGHRVTAIVRNPGRVMSLPGVVAIEGDVNDQNALADLLEGHDAVISSVMFTMSDPAKLINAVRSSGVKRYLVVGGAGSLEVAPGVTLLETAKFPEEYRAEATAGANFLTKLRASDDLEWTFLSPSAEFTSGERTGKFRRGAERLLVTDAGSRISFEDYAIAIVDELENPKHIRARFTVGY